jgi:hypothetical protein
MVVLRDSPEEVILCSACGWCEGIGEIRREIFLEKCQEEREQGEEDPVFSFGKRSVQRPRAIPGGVQAVEKLGEMLGLVQRATDRMADLFLPVLRLCFPAFFVV